jgi:hypothetical protein
MDVGEWLKGVGLGQYEATFRAHDIDVDVLPVVTAHAVLAPALEGFVATPEMPEIAEARALLAALGRG